jgi:hypothetical protein
MATENEKVKAKIFKIYPSDIRKDTISGKRYEHGSYIVVEVLDTKAGWVQHYNFNFGQWGAPPKDIAIGKEGYLQWTNFGNYHGPAWVDKDACN